MIQLVFNFFDEKPLIKTKTYKNIEIEEPFKNKEEIIIFNKKGDKTVILTDKKKEGNTLFFILSVCREYASGGKEYVDKHLWKSFHEAKADLEDWKLFAQMSDW